MITFDKVVKRYPEGKEALSGVSFQLSDGEMAFLTGHSGAGKSTLLRLASLIERSSAGEVYFDGQALSKVGARHIPFLRRRMGLIFQSPKLIDDRTIFNNVAFPLLVQGVKPAELQKRVRTALDLVGLLTKEKCLPKQLSTGEQQRVGIARAVVHKPSLILADEPTGNLDPALSAEIMQLLSRLNDFGVTVLIATHDLSLISTMHYRTLVLKEGRMLC